MNPGTVYTIVPSTQNYIFTPSSRTYTSTITADQANQDFANGKRWTGLGADALASNPLNWTNNEPPHASDVLRFDATNASKGCLWDLTTQMNIIELKVGFSSSVVAVADMNVGTITVEAGEALFGSHDIQITKGFYHSGGRFRFSAGGIARWTGTTVQIASMTKTNLPGGLYDSYFAKFTVQTSTTVRAVSDLVIDETFNINASGRFETNRSTLTLTGGTQSGAGGNFNWDDSAGTFAPGSGGVEFASPVGGSFSLKQGGSSSFNNLTSSAATTVTTVSNLIVNGALSITGANARMDLSNAFNHTFNGTVAVGPASTSGSPTLTVGASTANFNGAVLVGTATLSVQNGQVNVQSSSLQLTAQGKLQVPSSNTGRFVFWNGTQMTSAGGTLLLQGTSVFTSSAPSVARYAVTMNGTVNIQNSTVFASMDANGFRLGSSAVPANLKSLTFQNGVTGGAALNFDPVSVTNLTVDSPSFDVSFSTNVRAILDTSVVGNSDVRVIDATGLVGPSYEVDPSAIVNWGIIGTPTNFSGTTLGISSITWSWTAVNHPLNFLVKSSTNGVLSPLLGFTSTSWTETGLSTNTSYMRYVEAVTDVAAADSSSSTKYTDAMAAANLAIIDVGFSSMTLSWGLNTNPANTTFALERSTDDVIYAQLASNTLANLVPYLDTNLIAEKTYFYRVKALNGDGRVAPGIVKVSSTTSAVPPPVISSIVPSTVTNLGKFNFTIAGANIQSGAILKFKKSATQIVVPLTSSVVTSSTMTGRFNMTGVVAGAWDVIIENPDGKISSSGTGLLTVTNASSGGDVTIQTYVSTAGVSFSTLGGETALTLAASALPDARIYVSVNPTNTPLNVDPTLIASANAALSGLTLVPNSIREVMAYTAQGAHTSGFTAPVTMSIVFTDSNHDAIVDGVSLRTSTLRLLTLNETSGTWETIAGATLDSTFNRITSPLSHFSVYALAGSPAAATLQDAKLYPSPWKMGAGGKFDAAQLTFANLTESGRISIYNLTAELVRKIDFETSNAGVVVWDGKNTDGQFVKSGVYLVHIKSSTGEIKMLKVGIER